MIEARGARKRRKKSTPSGVTVPDFGNLDRCIKDVQQTFLETDPGPPNPTNYADLRRRLEVARKRLPPLYVKNVYKPITQSLEEMGAENFTLALVQQREEMAILLDIAQAVLQNGERYQDTPTDAFQEVVSDLYDGFLSNEDRRGVKKPDHEVIPPMVKWGGPGEGPWTWPIDATSIYDVRAAIVNLMPVNGRAGLLAWGALGHETAGHDILRADEGLRPELAKSVWEALKNDGGLPKVLPGYWAERIEETASDVLGILNMGPAAGIGVLGMLRGARWAWEGEPVLGNISGEYPDDPYPCDILRAYLAAATVRLLSFDGRDEWADKIEAEADKDLSTINLHRTIISSDDGKKSAAIVAKTLVKGKMKSLEYRPLIEIQDWQNRDEEIVLSLQEALTLSKPLPETVEAGTYAAHVVAAAVITGLQKGADIPTLFNRMVGLLKIMHDKNPSWGPMYVAHPGNLLKIRALSYPS